LLLKLPILGEILRKIGVARFTRTLATFMTSGVPILEGLNITPKPRAMPSSRMSFINCGRGSRKGETWPIRCSSPGSSRRWLPKWFPWGIHRPKWTPCWSRLPDYYEEEVDEVMKNLLTILEPILMVFLGVVVGGVVIALYLPMFKLIRVLSGG